jgi:hypothetical protein
LTFLQYSILQDFVGWPGYFLRIDL